MEQKSRVTTHRESQGLTIRALSELAGVAPRTIERIERGDVDPQLGTRKAIARGLKVAPGDLWPGLDASVRERRICLSLSQEGLAARAEVSTRSVRNLEREVPVSDSVKGRILSALNALEFQADSLARVS